MAHSLYVKGKADKELARLPRQAQDRINAAIDDLADEPHPYDSKKLQGREGYSLRVGRDYRVLYLVDDQEQSVTVTKVGTREGVYE